MLKKMLLLFLVIYLSQPITAMVAAEDIKPKSCLMEESDKEAIKSFLLSGDKLSTELWKIYSAQIQEAMDPNEIINIKIAWLLTIRPILLHIFNITLFKSDAFQWPSFFSFLYVKLGKFLSFAVSKEQRSTIVGQGMNMNLFIDDTLGDMVCDIIKDRFNILMENQKSDSLKADFLSVFANTYKIFSQNIGTIIKPTLKIVLENLPVGPQYHPFKDDDLKEFYEKHIACWSEAELRFIAPHLLPILPFALVPEHHRELFAELLMCIHWPLVRELVAAQMDEGELSHLQLPKELIGLISVYLILG